MRHYRVLSPESASQCAFSGQSPRRGAATLDYALVLGVILPLATIVIPASIVIIRSVYQMIVTMIAWPFL